MCLWTSTSGSLSFTHILYPVTIIPCSRAPGLYFLDASAKLNGEIAIRMMSSLLGLCLSHSNLLCWRLNIEPVLVDLIKWCLQVRAIQCGVKASRHDIMPDEKNSHLNMVVEDLHEFSHAVEPCRRKLDAKPCSGGIDITRSWSIGTCAPRAIPLLLRYVRLFSALLHSEIFDLSGCLKLEICIVPVTWCALHWYPWPSSSVLWPNSQPSRTRSEDPAQDSVPCFFPTCCIHPGSWIEPIFARGEDRCEHRMQL